MRLKSKERESTDRIDYVGNYSKSNFNQTPIIGKNGIAPTVTENHGQVAAIPIINATKQGYILAYVGDGVDLETRKGRRGRVQKGMSQTINTSDNKGVVVPTEPVLLGGIGEKDSNSNTQWKQQNRIYSSSSSSSAVTTSFQPYYYNLRIRKLTPRECGRLQGIKDGDFDKIAKNQSNSSLYHLFGDSISTNVLVALYYQLFSDQVEKSYTEIMEGLADSVCECTENGNDN